MQKQKKKGLEDLELRNKEELMRRREELEATTWLSERQVELYLLYNSEEFDQMKDVAEALGIKPDTAYKTWRDMKDRVAKSKHTLGLNIGSNK